MNFMNVSFIRCELWKFIFRSQEDSYDGFEEWNEDEWLWMEFGLVLGTDFCRLVCFLL